jgi:hypothetical protein
MTATIRVAWWENMLLYSLVKTLVTSMAMLAASISAAFRWMVARCETAMTCSLDKTSWGLLNIAEGEPWTDGGWTKVAHKTNETRPCKVASGERFIGNNGYDEIIDEDDIGIINAMNTNHRKRDNDNEHGRVYDREWRKENQRLDWKIEHID